MAHTFYTPSRWIEQPVRITMLGAGGTGGEVLYALARIAKQLAALGSPDRLHVTLIDGDVVSASNLGRQRFAECDIGHSKAHVLIQRINLFFDFDWTAVHGYWTPEEPLSPPAHATDLLITCVDRAQVRVALAKAGARQYASCLWMDFGNDRHTGQCVLGHLGRPPPETTLRLPNIYDLHTELATLDDTDTPSCSAAEALQQQDLFVNALLAEAGMSVLWKLLRHGQTDTHGVLIDVREPSVEPLAIDPVAWEFYRTAKTGERPPAASAPPTRARTRAKRTPHASRRRR